MPDAENGIQDQEAQKSLKEAITKINELKYSCGEEIQAASHIKYVVIDIRSDKRGAKVE